jgi:hypothetical protein
MFAIQIYTYIVDALVQLNKLNEQGVSTSPRTIRMAV